KFPRERARIEPVQGAEDAADAAGDGEGHAAALGVVLRQVVHAPKVLEDQHPVARVIPVEPWQMGRKSGCLRKKAVDEGLAFDRGMMAAPSGLLEKIMSTARTRHSPVRIARTSVFDCNFSTNHRGWRDQTEPQQQWQTIGRSQIGARRWRGRRDPRTRAHYGIVIGQSGRKIPVFSQPLLSGPSVIRHRMLAVQMFFGVQPPVEGFGSNCLRNSNCKPNPCWTSSSEWRLAISPRRNS